MGSVADASDPGGECVEPAGGVYTPSRQLCWTRLLFSFDRITMQFHRLGGDSNLGERK